jgi:hypothetical protein
MTTIMDMVEANRFLSAKPPKAQAVLGVEKGERV